MVGWPSHLDRCRRAGFSFCLCHFVEACHGCYRVARVYVVSGSRRFSLFGFDAVSRDLLSHSRECEWTRARRRVFFLFFCFLFGAAKPHDCQQFDEVTG